MPAWISAAASVAGAAISANAKKGTGSMPGMATDARTSEAVFDNSGWNVSFGSSKIDSTAVKSVDQAGPSTPNSMGFNDPLSSLGQLLPTDNKTLIYVAIGAIVLISWKRKKS